MLVVAQILALLVALIHLLVFVFESLLFQRPSVHRGIFGTRTEDAPAVRLWAFGVGFYNLFLALGLIAGVVAIQLDRETIGRTLLIYLTAIIFLAGVVLLLADRLALSRPRGTGLTGAAGQGVPGLAAFLALLAT